MFFKNRYKKLKREEVVQAILDLEKQEQSIEDGIVSKKEEINSLMSKGKASNDRELKIFYAKKINHLEAERKNDLNRSMYLLYNIQLLKKLKDAIDDKDFIANVGKIPLNMLLKDQKGLAKFLNTALNNKISAENVMTNADEVFREVQSQYEPNQDIYGISSNDDSLLAIFETEQMLNDSDPSSEAEYVPSKKLDSSDII